MFRRRVVDSDTDDVPFPDPDPEDIRRHVACKRNPAFRAALDTFDRSTDELLEQFHRDRAAARVRLFDALLHDLNPG